MDGSDAFDPELYKILYTYISKNPQHITVLSDKDEERLGGSHDGRAGRGGKI